MNNIIKSHEETFKASHPSKKFFGGMEKGDVLTPVKTVVLFLSAGKWTGPRSLHEMFAGCPGEILDTIQDYKMDLIIPSEMSEEDLARCTSELREVLAFIKASNDKETLEKLVEGNDRFKAISTDAAKLINAVTDAQLPIDTEKEVYNMCEAIRGIRNAGKELGIAEGKELGEENYRRKQRELRTKLKAAGREAEFFDVIDDDTKMDRLFKEFDIN